MQNKTKNFVLSHSLKFNQKHEFENIHKDYLPVHGDGVQESLQQGTQAFRRFVCKRQVAHFVARNLREEGKKQRKQRTEDGQVGN